MAPRDTLKKRKAEKIRPGKPKPDTPHNKVQPTLESPSGTRAGNPAKNLSDSLFHTRSNPPALYDTLLDKNSVTDSLFNPDSLLTPYAASYGEKLENELEAQLQAHLQKALPPLENPLTQALLVNNPLTGASLPAPSLTDHSFKSVSDQVLTGPLVDLKKLQQAHLPDPATLQAGVKQMQPLKQKYQTLADSRKADEAVGKHSLKTHPFRQRLEAGLGASIRSFKPFEADMTPMVGYRISRIWTTGIGIILGTHPSLKPSSPPIHAGINPSGTSHRDRPSSICWAGYQGYALYTLTSYLRLHALYQYRRSQFETAADQRYRHQLLGGISNELKLIRNVRLRSTVLYRFNRQAAFRNGSPFQVSVGIVAYFDQ